MTDADIINEHLKKQYGMDINMRPFYRIVQNINLTEKRFITHVIYDIEVPSKLPVECLKYNYLPEGYWILEQLFNTTNPELVENFSYEPAYVFKGPDGEYQAPNLRGCQFLIACIKRGPVAVLSEAEKMANEKAKFFEMLGGKSDLGEAIGAGDGVSYSGLDPKTSGLDTPAQKEE
jgi:hypothetical protein